MKKTLLLWTLAFQVIAAEETKPAAAESEWVLLAGLNQPIVLRGGNIELNYLTQRWVFEYSHGFALNLSPNRDFTMTQAERDQKLDLYLPFSTGGGIGYRITPEFNVRAELKAHRYEVTRGNESVSYTTFSVGIGAYYYWYPFGNRHFVVVPSLRFWPNVASTLGGNAHTWLDGQSHTVHEFTFFANVSLGYRF
jgi:hypothetical protein